MNFGDYIATGSPKIKRGVSALALGLFLVLQAMVIFPAFHAAVHSDANEVGHQCAVTLFSHGQVDASTAAVPLVSVSTPLIFRQSLPAIVFVSVDHQLLPCRGPPACSVLA